MNSAATTDAAATADAADAVAATMLCARVLADKNAHELDKQIQFFEEGHKYVIANDAEQTYTSVTTFIHSLFPGFNAPLIIDNMMKGRNWNASNKYWGMSSCEIQELWARNGCEAAKAGTQLHFMIECFMNCSELASAAAAVDYTNEDLYNHFLRDTRTPETKTETLEWNYFIHFIRDHPSLKPYRTEWTIHDDELKIAGSIDMVFENPDGTLSIYDWKRTKEINEKNTFKKFATHPLIAHLPDTNYWHYALQLNTYKALLERKYGKTIADLYLVRLHPDAEHGDYELILLPDLSKEVGDLFADRIVAISFKN